MSVLLIFALIPCFYNKAVRFSIKKKVVARISYLGLCLKPFARVFFESF